jgi:hypothetical protein
MFICAHCPYVKHIERAWPRWARTTPASPRHRRHQQQRCHFTHPADSPAGLKQQAETLASSFPTYTTKRRAVAHAYKAACTPDFFLFDADFRWSIAASSTQPPRQRHPVTGEDLRAAIDLVLAGKPVPADQRPPSAATSSGRRKKSGVSGWPKLALNNAVTRPPTSSANSAYSSSPFRYSRNCGPRSALQRKLHRRLQHAELIARVEALAFKGIAKDLSLP